MLTAQQARQMTSTRKISTKELNEIEDLILLAIQRGDDGIQVQLPEQQIEDNGVCPTVTQKTLNLLHVIGYEVVGPVSLALTVCFGYYEDGLKNRNTMCYRVSW